MTHEENQNDLELPPIRIQQHMQSKPENCNSKLPASNIQNLSIQSPPATTAPSEVSNYASFRK